MSQIVDFRLERGFTLEQALQMIYEDDEDVDQIFIEPPESNVLTDEDSGDEDEAGLIDNLNRQQLLAPAEVRLRDNVMLGAPDRLDENGNTQSKQDIIQLPNVLPQRPGLEKISWIDGDLIPNTCREFPKFDSSKYEDMTNLEIFETFIDAQIIDLLVKESTNYALFVNKSDPKISPEEMKCAIAIMILSGYHELPGRDFYWDSGKDMNVPAVAEAMRRDRFRQILRFLHCADNNKPMRSDKMWKLRPLMDLMKERFMKNWVPKEHLDYDESMIKYFGKHSAKQFIRGKPIRFGYKMWCLNSECGYLVNFDLYQGQNPRGKKSYEDSVGKCAAPLLNMIEEIPHPLNGLPFKFYFDNLFTGFNLLYLLKQRGYDGTGTIRDNRIPKSCTIPDKKNFARSKSRGEIHSLIDQDDGIIIVKWKDNNVVAAASTCHGVAPTSLVKRYSQKEKRMIQVQRPSIIGEYNKFMGGTDLMDEHIGRYRISFRRKKWWWPIFTWLLDAAIVNAWIISRQCKTKPKISQLEFRRQVVQIYLDRYRVLPKSAGKPTTSKSSATLSRVSDDIRYDHLDHLLIPTPEKKKRRCAGEGCTSIMRTMCQKCNVGLCIECNTIFHSK